MAASDTTVSSLEKHATLAGTIATFTSAAASPFMSGDYRIFGYIFAAANILLTCLVAQHKVLTVDVRRRKFIVIALAMISISSLVMLGISYAHPQKEAKAVSPPLAQPSPSQPAPVMHESHDTYTTTGKNSPIINGTTAPIHVGDNEDPGKKDRKHK